MAFRLENFWLRHGLMTIAVTIERDACRAFEVICLAYLSTAIIIIVPLEAGFRIYFPSCPFNE